MLAITFGAVEIMSIGMPHPKSSCVSRIGSPNIGFEQIFFSRISR
jgi:hypothetical protein